jgi:hypothetical protein
MVKIFSNFVSTHYKNDKTSLLPSLPFLPAARFGWPNYTPINHQLR